MHSVLHYTTRMSSRIVFFDTETTGLPTKRNISALKEQGVWPDIVSICWWVFEGTAVVKKANYLIRPTGWSIPYESTKIHGITQSQALSQGSDLLEVLLEFKTDIQEVKYLVAHNMEFDKNVILNAFLWRLKIDPSTFWPSDAEFCSAQKSKDELKLASLYPKPWDLYKIPKLDELYQATFYKASPSGAHNAERDVDVLQQIFWARWSL